MLVPGISAVRFFFFYFAAAAAVSWVYILRKCDQQRCMKMFVDSVMYYICGVIVMMCIQKCSSSPKIRVSSIFILVYNRNMAYCPLTIVYTKNMAYFRIMQHHRDFYQQLKWTAISHESTNKVLINSSVGRHNSLKIKY